MPPCSGACWAVLATSAAFGLVTLVLIGVDVPRHAERYPCNASTYSEADIGSVSSWTGIVLTIVGNGINAVGISVQKKAHLRLARVQPSRSYFRDGLWWLGLALVALGEGVNAVAYGYAPTNIIAPLGGLTLVLTTTIAVCAFGERPRSNNLVGSAIVLVGIVLSTASTTETTALFGASRLLELYGAAGSVIWLVFLGAGALFLLFFAPIRRLARRWVAVWAAAGALVSSYTITACRGFFSMLALAEADCDGRLCVETATRRVPCMETVGSWLFWFLLGTILVTAFVANAQIDQMGLRLYDQSRWVPVHLACCTVLFTFSGAIVYQDFDGLEGWRAAVFSVGFVLVILGVGLVSIDARQSIRGAIFANSIARSHHSVRLDRLFSNPAL